MATKEMTQLLDRFRTQGERISVKGPREAVSDPRLDEARRKVQAHPAIPAMRAAKGRLISITEGVRKDIERLEADYRNGLLTDTGYRGQRDHLQVLMRRAVRQVLEEYAKSEEALLRDLRPEVRSYPVTESARQRLQAYMLTEASLTPEQTLAAIRRAVEDRDLPFLQEVRPVVENRARASTHDRPGEPDPLAEAEALIEDALRTEDVRAGELAHALAPSMAGQLEVVARQIEERGRFAGPAATMRPATTDLFPVVTDEERAIHGDGADFAEALAAIQEALGG